MKSEILNIIDGIFAQLRGIGSFLAERRRPGLGPDIIKEKIRSLGLFAPKDLVQLYAICDGTTTNAGEALGQICFFPGFHWLSLEESILNYNLALKCDGWNKFWFPVFSNGGGDFYAVICDKNSKDFGQVVGFIRGESDTISEFKSIFTMLSVIEKSFANGAFFISGGYMEADYPKMRSIARAIQPDFMEHDA